MSESMSDENNSNENNDNKKASATLPGIVQRVIKAHPGSGEPEKAQITVEGADDLYREIRIENTLTDEKGNEVKLKPGATVEVTVEAEPKDTVSKDAKTAGK